MSEVQSVRRAIAIVIELGNADEGLSLTVLSKNLGLNISTVSRLLKTLRADGIVQQDQDSLKYSLGNGFMQIALKYLGSMDLRKAAVKFMQQLQESTGETVNLGIIDDFELVYIDRILSRQDFRHSIAIGKRAPIHCTSLGKAIIAFMDRGVIYKNLSKNPLEKNTPFTKDSPDEIMEELQEIRKTHVAVDDREHQEHIRCVGSPIFDVRGNVVGAISVSGPYVRIDHEKLDQLKQEIKKTAELISKELGWIEE